jgi:hypothetical protein
MSIRTFAVALSATLALIAGPVTLPCASAADAPAAAAPAAAAFDDSTPEALVASAVKALKANDLIAFFHRLPVADQAKLQENWARMTGNQFMTGMIDRRIPQLTGETLTTAVVAALTGADLAALSARLKQFAGNADPAVAAAAADPNQPPPGGGGFGAFGGFGGGGGRGGPLMPWFEGTATELVGATLASGLETQQTEAYQGLISALGDWAAKAPLTDKDKATAFAGELSAAVEALGIKTGNDLTATTVSDLITKLGESVHHLKTGLALFELQADAALDTVKLSDVKPIGSAGDTVSATLHVTALGSDRTLALKFVKKDGHWNVAADSPLLAWLRNRTPGLVQMLMFGGGRGPGGPGGPGGGRNRGQRPAGQGGGQGGQAPAGPDANPAAPKPNPGF